MPHFRKHRPGCVAILAISTVLAMFFANAFLGLKRLVSPKPSYFCHTAAILSCGHAEVWFFVDGFLPTKTRLRCCAVACIVLGCSRDSVRKETSRSCASDVALHPQNTGGSYRRSAVAFAGFLTYAAFNMLLIIALGRYENDHPVNNTAVYPQQREVSGLDNNGPKMGANTGGPAINPVRGYAGPTPGNGTPVLHTDRNIV